MMKIKYFCESENHMLTLIYNNIYKNICRYLDMKDIWHGISYILGVLDRSRLLIMMEGGGVNNHKHIKPLVCSLHPVLAGIENAKMKKSERLFL